jgi:uncharacterized protein (DUF1015 family)
MAEIKPFKGIFYNPDKVREISLVTAPPYDIIPDEEKEKYFCKDEHNIIRLILSKEKPGDNDSDNRYIRSAETFKKWLQEGILARDSDEAVYIYRQEYFLEGEKKILTGLICALKIEEPGRASTVLPHEKTLGEPREDRLNLIRTSMANFSPIFGMFEDPGRTLIGKATEKADENPVVDFKDENDIRHTVLKVSNPEIITTLQNALKEKTIFIADGHHRYEAAGRLRKELIEANPDYTGEEPFNYIMAYLVNMRDEGLTILPTHRLIKKIPEENKDFINNRLKEFFVIEESADYEAVAFKMGESFKCNQHSFGIYYENSYYFLRLKEDSGYDAFMEGKYPALYKELDVCIAHGIIIDHAVNGGAGMPQSNLDYEKDPQKAISLADDKRFELVLFLNPTRIEQVLNIASSGMQMPGKATYFYPKPMGGLLLRQL